MPKATTKATSSKNVDKKIDSKKLEQKAVSMVASKNADPNKAASDKADLKNTDSQKFKAKKIASARIKIGVEKKAIEKEKPAGNSASTRGKKNTSSIPRHDLVSKETAAKMMDELCKLYPDADCELTYKNDFELLTSVILSAQTTDVQVNKVTPGLFKKFPTAKALAEGNLDEIKDLIKATGYYNNKAKSIQSCAASITQQFNSQVPANLEDLITLPGVGRKTANVVLGVIHKVPGWTVDTHVQRLSQRLGFTKNTDPYKIELDLQKLFPKQDWTKYSITLIWHGRRLCNARKPDCVHCPLNKICPASELA